MLDSPAQAPQSPADPPSRRYALGVIFLTVFLDLLGFGIIIPILQLYAQELHATVPQTGWLMASYSMMQLLFAPVWGRLSDRVGRRPVLLISTFGSCASQLGYALSPTFGFLLASRALAGVCGANIGAAQAYIADITDDKSRAGAMGLIGAAFGLGFVFGPFLGGELGQYGARVPFFVASALSALNWVLAYFLLKEPRPAHLRAHATVLTWEGLAKVVSRPDLLALLSLFLIATFGFANMEGVFAIFCNVRFGFNKHDVGRLFALIGVVIVVVQGGMIRRLVPRLGERVLVIVGAGLMVLGLLVLAMAHSVPWLIVGLVVMATGSGLHSPSISSLISRAAGQQQGSVLGVSQSLGAVGRILGPVVGTYTFALGPSVPLFTGAGCMAIGLLVAVALVRQPAS